MNSNTPFIFYFYCRLLFWGILNKLGYSAEFPPESLQTPISQELIFVIHNSHCACVQYLRTTSITTTLVPEPAAMVLIPPGYLHPGKRKH
jgi:hypothetical protein